MPLYEDCDCCACRAARSMGCHVHGRGRHIEGRPYDGAYVNADGELVLPAPKPLFQPWED